MGSPHARVCVRVCACVGAHMCMSADIYIYCTCCVCVCVCGVCVFVLCVCVRVDCGRVIELACVFCGVRCAFDMQLND